MPACEVILATDQGLRKIPAADLLPFAYHVEE